MAEWQKKLLPRPMCTGVALPLGSPRPMKRSCAMDGTLALVQAAEHVGMISGSQMSVAQTMNGVTTTTVIAQDGGVDGEPRTSGDEEQPGFGTPSQGGPDLSTISPQAIYLTTGSMSPDQLLHQQNKPGEVNEVTLVRLKARSQSVGNFAVHLVREMFKPHELHAKNVSGNAYTMNLNSTRQLASSLLTTWNRLVVNKLLQAMRTHPDIGLLSTDLLQLACFWLCTSRVTAIHYSANESSSNDYLRIPCPLDSSFGAHLIVRGIAILTSCANKGEFRFQPISVFVYICVLSQSHCVKSCLTQNLHVVVEVTWRARCKWIFHFFTWNRCILFARYFSTTSSWGFVIYRIFTKI